MATAEVAFKYTCSKNQGAVLYLNEPADRRAVYKNDVWVRYIKANYASWMASLESTGLKDVELVVVRGWIKASVWAVAAWCDKSTEHEVTLSGNGGIAQAGFTFATSDETTSSVMPRAGPQDRLATVQPSDSKTSLKFPRDQCIFMSYFKVVNRIVWLTIRAKAGYHTLPPGDGAGDGGDTVLIETEGLEADEVGIEIYPHRISSEIFSRPETRLTML